MRCVLCGQIFQHSRHDNKPKLTICAGCFSKQSKRIADALEQTINRCALNALRLAKTDHEQAHGGKDPACSQCREIEEAIKKYEVRMAK